MALTRAKAVAILIALADTGDREGLTSSNALYVSRHHRKSKRLTLRPSMRRHRAARTLV
jgi:hypothetical protein